MKQISLPLLFAVLLASCTPKAPHAQTTTSQPDRAVGGRCEGCEAYAAGMPAQPGAEIHLAGPAEPGERLTISGTIYRADGRTPAAGIILYLYQTNSGGLYSAAKNQQQGREHGHLRGWIKTGPDGQYRFHTILPGSYPNSNIPRHIHPMIKEPGISVYYIDDYLFDNDPFLTPQERKKQEQRGGGGIIQLQKDSKGQLYGQRDIILGKNIPGY